MITSILSAPFFCGKSDEIFGAFFEACLYHCAETNENDDNPRINDPAVSVIIKERGKDFIQLKNGPFDLDLIFAPDGIETFAEAWQRHVEVEGFPVCHPDDIIRSKAATNRVKDRESLPRLQGFRDYWLRTRTLT